MKKITLGEFVSIEKSRILKFAENWREMQERDGQMDWPEEMPEADWVEQLFVFFEEN